MIFIFGDLLCDCFISETTGNGAFTYFSAVCWLYAKYLHKYINYPLGMIDTTWGGTPVEAWSSAEALAKCGIKE